MLSRLRSHVGHNVVGYLALFFALSGVAYAAGPLKPGDPAGGDLTGTYPNPTVADGAITPSKLKTGLEFTDAGLADQPTGCEPSGWYQGPGQPVGYARDPFGIVHLRGVVVKCNASGFAAFTLPVGFRPAHTEHFAGVFGGSVISVRPTSSTPSSGIVNPAIGDPIGLASLSGITFRCAPSGQDGCP